METKVRNLQKYEGLKKYMPPVTSTNTVRLNLNENLFGPSPVCLEALRSISLKDFCYYDLLKEDFLVEKISKVFSIAEENLFLHNGSSELIRQIFSMALERGDTVLVPDWSWSYYQSVSKVTGATICKYKLLKENTQYIYAEEELIRSIRETSPKVVVITSPNMPTGNTMTEKMMKNMVSQFEDVLFIIDQAYWGFAEWKSDIKNIIDSYTNIVFVRTFSKFFGLANERIGYCVCNSNLRELFSLELPLFKVSFTSRKLAEAALGDMEYYKIVKHEINKQKEILINSLNELKDITAFESQANFVFCEVRSEKITELMEEFEKIGYLVRVFPDNKYHYVRITIGTKEVMENVIQVFKRCFS